MGLKVAIVGLSPSHDLVTFDNHEGWELWGLEWDGYWARYDRIFQMHTNCEHNVEEKSKTVNTYTHSNYPIKDVIEIVGDYFSCSISYMIALAIYEGAEEISLFGVDAMDDGHIYQRSNIEYLIGFAKGKGIKVNILEGCPLAKFVQRNKLYKLRYGYEHN